MANEMPPIIEGFFEGLLAPIGESILIVSKPALQALQNTTTNITAASHLNFAAPISVSSLFLYVFLFELGRNFFMGLVIPDSGAGYIIGAIIGLVIMGIILSSEGVWSVVAGIVCVGLGLSIRVVIWLKNSPN